MTFRVVLAAAATSVGVGLAVAPVAVTGPPYKNCTEARQDGRSDIPRGDSAYAPKLDRDNDGIACES
ncbi:MAG TPA: excalibur calcium-binding domain-containing protein [Mycobacterium sp.]|nr:excalibur calcium-binding domain-containing protein [Mycobacterium sp.]